MKKLLLLATLCTVLSQLSAQSQKVNVDNLDGWQVVNRKAELINETGKKGIHLNDAEGDGLLILKDSDFSSGTIELDIKGKNLMQRSFVGLAFHIKDNNTYEAVYFRPFNFMNADTARRWRAVQYISHPEHTWDKLRAASPGKYENKVNPVPDPDGWFHVKIVVDGNSVKAFVNNATKPSLEIEKIGAIQNGKIGFWVGHTAAGSFANLVITALRHCRE